MDVDQFLKSKGFGLPAPPVQELIPERQAEGGQKGHSNQYTKKEEAQVVELIPQPADEEPAQNLESAPPTDKGDRVNVSRYLAEQGFDGGIEPADRG